MTVGFGICGRYIRNQYGLFVVDDFDLEELHEMKQRVCDGLKLPEKNLSDHITLSDALIEIEKLITYKQKEMIDDAEKGVALL